MAGRGWVWTVRPLIRVMEALDARPKEWKWSGGGSVAMSPLWSSKEIPKGTQNINLGGIHCSYPEVWLLSVRYFLEVGWCGVKSLNSGFGDLVQIHKFIITWHHR